MLDHLEDLTETVALMGPLVVPGTPTPYYPLLSGSEAIRQAVLSPDESISTDQLGSVRQQSPADSGAVAFDVPRRLVINEIDFDDTTVDFVEIYLRRDSAPLDLAGYSLFINGIEAHNFSQGRIVGTSAMFAAGDPVPTLLNPGFGMVVALTNTPFAVTSDPTPVVSNSVASVTNLASRGIITIGKSSEHEPIVRSAYLGDFLDPADGTNQLVTTGSSISLAPQFRGFALVPHHLILPGPFDGINPLATGLQRSMGADSGGTPFGLDNAQPFARPDYYTTTEDDRMTFDVVANDFDADGNDRLAIVDVSAVSDPGVGDVSATNSLLGALLNVEPAAIPLRGARITFEPRGIPRFQALPVGVDILDTFYYEVIDVGFAPIEGFSSGTNTNTVVTSTNHRLASGESVTISGCSETNYNGVAVVQVINEHSFSIARPFVAGPAPTQNGTWESLLPRSPTLRSEASVSVKVSGVNDAPVAVGDLVTGVTQDSTVRVMIRPELSGSVVAFSTDPAPAPDMLSTNLLRNDLDIDSDDTWETLRVVGVMGSVNVITNYTGTPGQSPVLVHSPGHGLSTGDAALIANYGGHPSYNGTHSVTVLDADTFSIPLFYEDNDSEKGVWVILDDSNRYDAITADAEATVHLTLRADAREDHLIYDASKSMFLRALAEGEHFTNRFYYAVEDRHGAVGIGNVDVDVVGLNETPVATADPGGLGQLTALVSESNTLADVLSGGLNLMYILPPASEEPGRVNLQAVDVSGTITGTLVLSNLWSTDEETAFDIDTRDLLANDSDIDHIDTLNVTAVDALSREGASLGLAGGLITFDPTAATNLQALSRGEFTVDTFSVVVSDGMTAGTVTSLVAVLVVGVNP